MRRFLIGVVLASSLLPVTAAGAGELSTTSVEHANTERAAAMYPNSVVVLGHSAAPAYGSDPAHPYRDAPKNSWATGVNPLVKSIYSRILAVNPAIKGHNVNLARDEVTVKDLAAQAHKAVTLTPKPELVLIEIEGDVKCDGSDESRWGDFRTGVSTALDTLTKGLPNAKIFVVSYWGSFPSYVKYLEGLSMSARLKHAGKGLCQYVEAPSARVVPSHVAYTKKIVTGYNKQLAAACAQFPQCHYDRGAAQNLAVTSDDISLTQEDLTVQGQAKLADAEWAAMAGFINR